MLSEFLVHRVVEGCPIEKGKREFSQLMVAILDFSGKLKSVYIYLRNGARYSDFLKIFYHYGISIVKWQLFPKIIFPPFMAGILNFCMKEGKNAFIVETV